MLSVESRFADAWSQAGKKYETFVLPRDNQNPLEFVGRLVYSKSCGYMDFCIYATSDAVKSAEYVLYIHGTYHSFHTVLLFDDKRDIMNHLKNNHYLLTPSEVTEISFDLGCCDTEKLT